MIVKICYTKLVTNTVSKFYTTNPFQNVTDNANLCIYKDNIILLYFIINFQRERQSVSNI